MNVFFKISFYKAGLFIVILSAAVILFHLLVITGIIPYTIVWGGRLQTQREMILFESVSIIVNALLISVVYIKWKPIQPGLRKTATVILWLFAVLFFLNTIGNLMAKATLETIVFTPLTFISSILCVRLAIEK